MKTIITTVAAALLFTLSFNASAQDTKVKAKQEPVKQEVKPKAKNETKPKASTTPAQHQAQTPASSNTGVSKGTSTKPRLHKRTLKGKAIPASQQGKESAPVKKAD